MEKGQRQGTRFFRSHEVPGLEFYSRSQVSRFVPRHVHMVFSLGLTESGARIHQNRNGDFQAGPGCLTLVNADEVHSGGVPGGGFYSCRTLRLSLPLLTGIVAQVTGRDSPVIPVSAPVFRDDDVASLVRRLHPACVLSRLETEGLLLDLFSMLLSRHSHMQAEAPAVGFGPVSRAKEYLRECSDENISLADLAGVSGFTPFHLSRAFRKAFGVPPHQYLLQVRLQRAKDLLAQGHPIALVAQEVGFFDQSHLHRAFRRQFGTTPGRFHEDVKFPPFRAPG